VHPHRPDGGRAALPFGCRAPQPRLGRRQLAAEGIGRRIGQRGLRLDAQEVLQISRGGDAPAPRADVEGEPFDLLSHQPAFAGQAGDEAAPGRGRSSPTLSAARASRVQPGDVAGLVVVAGDCRPQAGDASRPTLRRAESRPSAPASMTSMASGL
jgi:hypothetical protein